MRKHLLVLLFLFSYTISFAQLVPTRLKGVYTLDIYKGVFVHYINDSLQLVVRDSSVDVLKRFKPVVDSCPC